MACHYPPNFGSIPKTVAADEDPVDVLVHTPFPLLPGVVVRCRAVGVLRMDDESGGDAKLLAVPADEICPLFEHWKSIADVPEIRLRQIQHFFEHYKDLEAVKLVKIIRLDGVDVAHAEILNGIKRYEAEKSSSAAR